MHTRQHQGRCRAEVCVLHGQDKRCWPVLQWRCVLYGVRQHELTEAVSPNFPGATPGQLKLHCDADD